MTKAMVHFIEGKVAALVDDAVDLDFLPSTSTGPRWCPSSAESSTALGWRPSRWTAFPVQKRRKEFAAVSADLNNIFFEQPFRVPDYFALVTRALIVLEGIALAGDPSFDIFKAAYPHGAAARAGAVRRRGPGGSRRRRAARAWRDGAHRRHRGASIARRRPTTASVL